MSEETTNAQVHQESEFQLTSPPDPLAQQFLEDVLTDLERPQPKRPLQCVTIKMPLPAYLRMKRAAQRWNLTYTDLLNFCSQRVVPVLEAPSGQVATLLEQHSVEEETRKARRAARMKSSRATRV